MYFCNILSIIRKVWGSFWSLGNFLEESPLAALDHVLGSCLLGPEMMTGQLTIEFDPEHRKNLDPCARNRTRARTHAHVGTHARTQKKENMGKQKFQNVCFSLQQKLFEFQKTLAAEVSFPRKYP